jgi:hypothetical protein
MRKLFKSDAIKLASILALFALATFGVHALDQHDGPGWINGQYTGQETGEGTLNEAGE